MKKLLTIFFSFFFACCLLPTTDLYAQSNKLDSLLQVLNTAKEDTIKIKALISLSQNYWYTNPDTAYHIAQKAYDMAQLGAQRKSPRVLGGKGGYKKLMANAENSMAATFYFRGNYPDALQHLSSSLKIMERLNNKNGIARSLGNIGNLYSEQSSYPEALKYYFRALEINEELGNKRNKAANLVNIGIVYKEQGSYPEALKYYFMALEINEELGNKRYKAVNLGNIGNVYFKQGSYPEALKYHFKALEIDKELGNKNGIARHLGNIGNVYDDQVSYPEVHPVESDKVSAKQFHPDWIGMERDSLFNRALKYYFMALEINEELGNKRGKAIKLGNIGALYTKQKKYTEAEQYLQQALALSEEIGYLFGVMNLHKNFSELYAETGQYQKAYKHNIEYSVAKDSLFNEEKSKDIGRVEARHETEMQMMEEQARAKVEAEKMEKEEKRRNYWQYSAIFIVFVVLFLGLFLLTRFHIPIAVAEGIIFIVFLLFFEFILVLAEPWIEAISHGEPAIILACNGVLAAVLFPFHSFFEAKVKQRIVKQSAVGNPPEYSGGSPLRSDRQLTKRKSNSTKFTLILLIVFTHNFYSYSPTKNVQIAKHSTSTLKLRYMHYAQFINRKSEIVNPTIDSLERLLKITKEDSSKQDIYYKLGNELLYSEPDKALKYYKKALKMAKKIEDKIGISACLSQIGIVFQAQGNYQKAMNFYKGSLKIHKQLFLNTNDDMAKGFANKGIAGSLLNIGEVNRMQGNYDIAINYYLQSLKKYEQLKDSPSKSLARSGKKGISQCWNNIGIIYYYQGNYEKAMDYFIRSLKIKEILGEKRLIANQMMNIGVILKNLEEIEKAKEYYLYSLSIHKKSGNTQGIASCLTNIANIYSIQKNYEKSLDYRLKALKMERELGNRYEIALLLNNIGNLYSQQGKYHKAIKHIKTSITIAKEIGSKERLMYNYEGLSEVYAQSAKVSTSTLKLSHMRYAKAFEYHKLYATMKDSLFNEEKSKEIGRLEEHYLIEKKIAKEKVKAKVEAEIKAEEKAQRHSLQYMGSFIVIVALLIVVFTLAGVYIPIGFAEILIFIIFVLFFEFILVLLDPVVDEFSGGAPAIKLAFNAMVAGMMYPLHRYLELKLKSMILKKKRKKI